MTSRIRLTDANNHDQKPYNHHVQLQSSTVVTEQIDHQRREDEEQHVTHLSAEHVVRVHVYMYSTCIYMYVQYMYICTVHVHMYSTCTDTCICSMTH